MTRVEKNVEKDGAATQQQFESVKAEFETAKSAVRYVEKTIQKLLLLKQVEPQSTNSGQKSQIVLKNLWLNKRKGPN